MTSSVHFCPENCLSVQLWLCFFVMLSIETLMLYVWRLHTTVSVYLAVLTFMAVSVTCISTGFVDCVPSIFCCGMNKSGTLIRATVIVVCE